MNKYNKIASEVLDNVGSKENVSKVFHCLTRLRFTLKDNGKVDHEALKKIDGVYGTNVTPNGEVQIIIGGEVDNVYKELIESGGFEAEETIDENLDEDLVSEETNVFKRCINNVIGAFSATMNPLVPVFVLVGVFNVIAALIGPIFLKLVSAESDLYTNFYNVGQAIIYFLPVLMSVPGSKYFKTNTFISMVLALLLVYPNFMSAIQGEYTVYGIPTVNVAYNGSVLPMMLIMWVQKYVEKYIDKVIPASFKIVLVPALTVMIMLPLAFCVLGPLGTRVGTLLAGGVIWLNQTAGPIETAIVAACAPFILTFGVGRPIFFMCMSMLFANGVEYAYMPIAMVLNTYVVGGVTLGYLAKAKTKEQKQLALTCSLSNLVGGTSEPSLFGILIPNRKTYLPTLIGGAVGGFYLGLMKVGYYQFGPTNFLSVLGYMGGPDNGNFVHGCIAAAICLIVTFVMMLVLYKNEEK